MRLALWIEYTYCEIRTSHNANWWSLWNGAIYGWI